MFIVKQLTESRIQIPVIAQHIPIGFRIRSFFFFTLPVKYRSFRRLKNFLFRHRLRYADSGSQPERFNNPPIHLKIVPEAEIPGSVGRIQRHIVQRIEDIFITWHKFIFLEHCLRLSIIVHFPVIGIGLWEFGKSYFFAIGYRIIKIDVIGKCQIFVTVNQTDVSVQDIIVRPFHDTGCPVIIYP